jgi:ABC-2 type transport system ATP-binding protein
VTALEVQALVKRYAVGRVLDGASLRVQCGEVVSVEGANGAGKSTLVSIIAGIIPPDAGHVILAGHPLRTARRAALASLGFAPDRTDLPGDLRVREWLDLVVTMRGAAAGRGSSYALLDARELEDARLSDLSLGQLRRVLLVSAWIGAPTLLVLDEPTDGLDAERLATLVALITDSARAGAGVLVTSHDTHFLRAIGARRLRLSCGKVAPEEYLTG